MVQIEDCLNFCLQNAFCSDFFEILIKSLLDRDQDIAAFALTFFSNKSLIYKILIKTYKTSRPNSLSTTLIINNNSIINSTHVRGALILSEARKIIQPRI